MNRASLTRYAWISIAAAIITITLKSAACYLTWSVALLLLRVGKENHSITLEANAHHLLTDVWTSVGVVLDSYQKEGAQFHSLLTRQAAASKFVTVHVLVPGDWTVQHGHELLERIEQDIRVALPNSSVLTHLEALDNPA